MQPHWIFSIVAAPVLAGLIAGCAADATRPALLDEPRILAIRTAPVALPAGATGEVAALAYDVTEYRWRGCAVPWTAATDPSCPTGAVALGEGATLAVAVPAGQTALYLRLDATGPHGAALPAVARWSAAARGANPAVEIVGADSAALPVTVAAGQSLTMKAATADAAATHTWFTTAGDFTPWRTRGAGPSVWAAPASSATADLFCVTRDGQGGVGWTAVRVAVAASQKVEP